ncbi:MAG: hypothetical protein R8G66_15115 [Cytophagales bacterium]|nr:hypothetical protein [Cytophagales bacterium]
MRLVQSIELTLHLVTATHVLTTQNKPPRPLPPKKKKDVYILARWFTLMAIYLSILLEIAYVAFWEQDFNDPDKVLKKYELIRQKHYEITNQYVKTPDPLVNEAFNALLDEFMKDVNNSAGDIQELATQSFNIVLGALLAFLSSTVTMIFQRNAGSGE